MKRKRLKNLRVQAKGNSKEVKINSSKEFDLSQEEPCIYQTKKYLDELTKRPNQSQVNSPVSFKHKKIYFENTISEWNNDQIKEKYQQKKYSFDCEMQQNLKKQEDSVFHNSWRKKIEIGHKYTHIVSRYKFNRTQNKKSHTEQTPQALINSISSSIIQSTHSISPKSISIRQLQLNYNLTNNHNKTNFNKGKLNRLRHLDIIINNIEKQRQQDEKLPPLQRLHGIHGGNRFKIYAMFKPQKNKKVQGLNGFNINDAFIKDDNFRQCQINSL